jgi:hypothetical protein
MVVVAVLGLVALLAANVWMYRERQRYLGEIARLRSSMTSMERERADAIVASEKDKVGVVIELLRRQARLEEALHLSVSLDSAAMYLEREGALLREMPVEVGAERLVGTPPDTVRLAPPRGLRTIVGVITDSSAWEVPRWVYRERGIAVDSSRTIVGALGPAAIILEGGTIIYSMPPAGPLADSAYVLPGAVRATASDLRAILPNLTPGMRVYFY